MIISYTVIVRRKTHTFISANGRHTLSFLLTKPLLNISKVIVNICVLPITFYPCHLEVARKEV